MKTNVIKIIPGYSLVIYSVLLLVFAILWQTLLPIEQKDINFIAVVKHNNWSLVAIVGWIAGTTGILGITGVYFKLSEKLGILGLIGFIFLFCGLVLHACTLAWEAVLWKIIAMNAPDSVLLTGETLLYTGSAVTIFFSMLFIFFFVGWIIFGIALYKARILPRYLPIIIIICGVLFQITPFLPGRLSIIGSLVYFPGCFLLGLKMIELSKNRFVEINTK